MYPLASCGRAAFRFGSRGQAFHSSSPACASTVLPPQPQLPILDIFDAPVRLGESSNSLRCHESRIKPSKPRETLPRPPPVPLPAPILFDGPSKLHNLPPQLRRLGPTPVRRPSRPRRMAFHTQAPLIQMFEGPAQLRRCAPTKSRTGRGASLKYILLIGIAGAAGGAMQVT